jgi:hypothetical protein
LYALCEGMVVMIINRYVLKDIQGVLHFLQPLYASTGGCSWLNQK